MTRSPRPRFADPDSRGYCRGRFADGHQPTLQLTRLQRLDRQADETADASLEFVECHPKSRHFLRVGPTGCRRIVDTPMHRHGVTGPDGTGLAGRVVTNSEDEVERRRAGRRELVPALAAQAGGRKTLLSQQCERERMNLALGMAAGTESAESPLAPALNKRLAENAAGGISRTQNEHVESPRCHGVSPGAQQVGAQQ